MKKTTTLSTNKLLTFIISFTVIFVIVAIFLIIHFNSTGPTIPTENQPATSEDAKINEAMRNQYYSDYPFTEEFNKKFVEQNGEQFMIYRIDLDQSSDCSSDICLRITDYTGNSRPYAEARIKSSAAPDNIELIYNYTPVQ